MPSQNEVEFKYMDQMLEDLIGYAQNNDLVRIYELLESNFSSSDDLFKFLNFIESKNRKIQQQISISIFKEIFLKGVSLEYAKGYQDTVRLLDACN